MSIQESKSDEAREGSRIAKVMARSGLCSRRDAEQWIAEGRVSVNGEVLTSPAFNVSDSDDVRIDGEPLRAAERTRLFLFHKPRGLVTTAKDPEGRSTIFDALPEDLPRVVAVGRLDINTEGLLLLTNDGGLSRVLELPATGWLRRYRVRAHGEITQEQLDGLRDGITIEGVNYIGIEAKFERQQGSNVWLTMGLREGKNREIKRVLEHMGLSVNRLIRVSFGPFELGDLPEGELMEVRTRVLRDQLGPKLAKQAGANFEAPAETPTLAPEPPRGGDRPMRRPRGDDPERRAPPREDAPRKRKHVSVLRAEARDETAGPRKRISRATTADRKGREVQVERISLANPPPMEPVRGRRPSRPTSGEGFVKRERAPRAEGGFGDRPARRPSGEGFVKRERAPRAEGGFGERPARRPAGEGFVKRERAPRVEGGFSDRPARRPTGEGFVKRERAPRAEGGFSDRPARRPTGEGFVKRERAPRVEGGFSDRPARRPTGEGFVKRERAPRAEGFGERRPSGEGFQKRERAPRAEGATGERPARRPAGEGFVKRERAPRSGGGFGDRRPSGDGFQKRERPPRAEGATGERPARRPSGEGFVKREYTPRSGGPGKPSRGGPPRGKPPHGKPPRKPRG